MSVRLSVCPSVRLPVRLSVCVRCLPVCLFERLFPNAVCPSVCQFASAVSQCVCPSVCLSVRLCASAVRQCICPSVCRSVRLSTCLLALSATLSVCLSVCVLALSVRLSVRQSVCLSVCLSACVLALSVRPSVWLSVCLSVCLSECMSVRLCVSAVCPSVSTFTLLTTWYRGCGNECGHRHKCRVSSFQFLSTGLFSSLFPPPPPCVSSVCHSVCFVCLFSLRIA